MKMKIKKVRRDVAKRSCRAMRSQKNSTTYIKNKEILQHVR